MNIAQYKHFLVKIKEDFQSRLHFNRSETLSVEEVSQLLYRHIREEPFMVRDFLLKGTGKLSITWDELLQYLQEEISIREEVKKIEHYPTSATEIIENHLSEFAKLIQYVKQKETNMIQLIRRLPVEVGGKDLFVVCMDKEIAFFDYSGKEMLESIDFRYSNMKEKIFEKEEQKRMQKERLSQQKTEEFLDKVVINQLDINIEERKKSSFGRLLTSNIRSSVRGSALSSDHSDKINFRKQTDSGLTKRRNKSNVIKIKNDDVSKIFQIFENATLSNSINVARAFTEARSNFQKHIVLDKSVLEGERPQKSYGLMSEIYEKNYKKELQQMRSTNNDLTKIRKSLSYKGKCFKPMRKLSENLISNQQSLKKIKRSSNVEPVQNQQEVLQIVHMSILSHYLLVSLFNREIRLLHMKKGLISIKVQLIFEKQFRAIVTFLELYLTRNREYRILVVLEKNGKGHNQQMQKSLLPTEDSGLSEVHLYHLDENMMISSKVMQCQIDFSAKYQSALPYGAVLFNQKGNFCLLELNNSLSKASERISFQTTLYNPENGFKVSINEVRIHRNLVSFFLCCSSGYVYLFDRLTKQIKYNIRVSPCAVLQMHFIKEDSQIIALYQNGNMVILSTLHLQKVFFYQSYHQVSIDSKIFSISPTSFIIYNTRSSQSYWLCENEEREFTNLKPIKILKNRTKLRKASQFQSKQRSRVYKVLNGQGGRGNFVCLIFQQGEICFLDPKLSYLGSYYCLKVTSIIDITCNENYQFICILYDDNTLEVVNLYTQNLLFPVVLPERDQGSRNSSTTNGTVERRKTAKSKIRQSIVLINFFRQDVPSLFLGIITQQNNVYHLSEKGTITSTVNLERSCRAALKYTQIIYQGESLVLLTEKSITVLHRQSYTKKCVIHVSQQDLMSIKRVEIDGLPGFLCIDRNYNVYLVDTNLKKVKPLCSFPGQMHQTRCLFNRYLILKQGEEHSKVKVIRDNKEITMRTDSYSHYYSIIGENILQISKQTGRLATFNFSLQIFQEFFI